MLADFNDTAIAWRLGQGTLACRCLDMRSAYRKKGCGQIDGDRPTSGTYVTRRMGTDMFTNELQSGWM